MTGRKSRPRSFETLETRELLSHVRAAVAHPARVQHPGHVQAEVVDASTEGFGALGDSLSDEYQFYAPDRSVARNWVEILASTRNVDFGPFTTLSRPEPRDQGYAYDWARSDSTSVDMVANQLPGLAAQVAAGKVGTVSILAGDNDFLHYLEAIAAGVPTPPSTIPADLAHIEATAQSDFDEAVTTLQAANPDVRIVASTIPGLSVVPMLKADEASIPGFRLDLAEASRSIAVYNAHIRSVAASNPSVALSDLAAQTPLLDLLGPTARFGGVTIDLTTPGDQYQHFFLADDLHPGTIGQGIIADTIAAAADQKFGAGIPLLTPGQIVAFAKSVPGSG